MESTRASEQQPINLHELSGLQEIQVREGVILRPLEDRDAPAIIAAIDADPSIRKRVTVAADMHTEDDVKNEVVKNKTNPNVMRFVIAENESCVGLVSLWRDTGYFGDIPKPNTYGFGYFLNPSARGKGLVTASVLALMEATSRAVQVDSFIAYCEDDNPSSVSVLNKLGFLPTDTIFEEPENGWAERRYERQATNGG